MGFKAAVVLGMLLSVTAIKPTKQQIKDACWTVYDQNSNFAANDLIEELQRQGLDLSVVKASKKVVKFLDERHRHDMGVKGEHMYKKSVGEVNCAAKQPRWAANRAQEGRLRRQAEAERAAELARLINARKRRRLPSVTMAQNSGMALKIKETHLTTQINRIQTHLQDGTDSAAAQNLLQKLQERSAIRTELVEMGKRRRLPSATPNKQEIEAACWRVYNQKQCRAFATNELRDELEEQGLELGLRDAMKAVSKFLKERTHEDMGKNSERIH